MKSYVVENAGEAWRWGSGGVAALWWLANYSFLHSLKGGALVALIGFVVWTIMDWGLKRK